MLIVIVIFGVFILAEIVNMSCFVCPLIGGATFKHFYIIEQWHQVFIERAMACARSRCLDKRNRKSFNLIVADVML